MTADNSNIATQQTPAGTGGSNPPVVYQIAQNQGGATPPVVNAANNEVDPEILKKFTIPEKVKTDYPDIIKLVIETASMNDDERQYWFQIIPIMTEEQVDKFRGILITEKDQLSKLDKEYEAEIKDLNQKHLVEWQAFESKEKRRKLQEEEQKTQQEETQKQEELLQNLSDDGK